MPEKTGTEDELALLQATVRFNARLLALVLGLIVGLAVFVATNWLIVKGGEPTPTGEVVVGPHLALLSQYFIGYSVTFAGSFIGFAYGFLVGAITGWLISRIYNWVAGFRT